MKKNPKINITEKRILRFSRIFIWLSIVIVMFPVAWIIMASVSKGDSFFSSSFIPEQISFNNYKDLFEKTDFIKWVINSLQLSLYVAFLQLVLSSTAAYAFSRMRFPGRNKGLMLLLVLQVFPNSMAIAGYYVLIYNLGLSDNFLVLTLVLAAGSAFNIWLLKSYMDGISKELDEAAYIDGANHIITFTKVILPLAKPQLVVIFLFSFIATYSEFVISSIFLPNSGKYTLAVGLQTFITNQFAANWTIFAAAAVLSSLPIMIIFMSLQRYIQSGLVAGGVKG